jgi:3-oxoacyl-[acyl-carrier protein] reductase
MNPENLTASDLLMANRTIIISGGSRGLGLAMVRHFLAIGDKVATFSRSQTGEISALQNTPEGDRLFYQAADAANADALRDFVKAVHQRFGHIDALVNNAGIAHDGVLALMPEQQIDQMLTVNLRAALLLCKECSRLMLVKGGGAIVNISSIIGENGFSGLSAYAATKAGMLGMTRALARELGPRNIRVNAIAPGYLETEMSRELSESQRNQIIRRTPLGRLGRVEDVTQAVDFLLSPPAAFITGQTINL